MKTHGRHHHNCDNPWDGAPPWAVEIGFVLGLVLDNQEKIMSALTDLQAAIADLQSVVADGVAEIEVLLTKIATPGTSDAEIVAATDQIRVLATAIRTEVDKAKAQVPA